MSTSSVALPLKKKKEWLKWPISPLFSHCPSCFWIAVFVLGSPSPGDHYLLPAYSGLTCPFGNSWSSVLPWFPELKLTLYLVPSICPFSCVLGEIMLKWRVQFLESVRAELVVDATVSSLLLKVNTDCTWRMPLWWVTWPVRISGCTDGCGSDQVRAWGWRCRSRQMRAGLLVKRVRIRQTCN